MTGSSTTTQATRRLLFAWNVAGAFRLATGWLAIVTSAALSFHVSPWIGIPAGFAVFGGALLLGRIVDRGSVRWVLGRFLPPGTASDLSLREATEVVTRKHWGTAQGARPFVLMRGFVDGLLLVSYVVSHVELVRRLGGAADPAAPASSEPPPPAQGGFELLVVFAAIATCLVTKEWLWGSLLRRLKVRSPSTWDAEGRPLWLLPLPNATEIPGGIRVGQWQTSQRVRWRWLLRTPQWAREDARSRVELWAVRGLLASGLALLVVWFSLAFRG